MSADDLDVAAMVVRRIAELRVGDKNRSYTYEEIVPTLDVGDVILHLESGNFYQVESNTSYISLTTFGEDGCYCFEPDGLNTFELVYKIG